MNNDDIQKAVLELRAAFAKAGLKDDQLKAALREIVKSEWPNLPSWTTLDGAVIEEVQKATVGSGVAMIFEEDGVKKVVLAQTGEHYKTAEPTYMIPGGFINLTSTPGSLLVPASTQPENAFTGAAREVEEELKKADGSPLIKADPAQLKPMDTLTLAFKNGEKRIVIGMMMELTEAQVFIVKTHIKLIAESPEYAAAAAAQSTNPASGKPEVSNVAIFTLHDVASGKVNLLHKDQQSLFQAVERHFAPAPVKHSPKPR